MDTNLSTFMKLFCKKKKNEEQHEDSYQIYASWSGEVQEGEHTE